MQKWKMMWYAHLDIVMTSPVEDVRQLKQDWFSICQLNANIFFVAVEEIELNNRKKFNPNLEKMTLILMGSNEILKMESIFDWIITILNRKYLLHEWKYLQTLLANWISEYLKENIWPNTVNCFLRLVGS